MDLAQVLPVQKGTAASGQGKAEVAVRVRLHGGPEPLPQRTRKRLITAGGLPVGFVVRARQIGTFETSILPYEDCCTVFTPRHPQTKPRLENVEQQEENLDIEGLVDEAFAGIERITLG